MTELFKQGKELIQIIEDEDWLLFDITHLGKDMSKVLEGLDYGSPADRIVKGNNYLFVPMPEEDQTIAEAYNFRNGFGPALEIADKNDPRLETVILYDKVISGEFGERTLPDNIALLSKLFFINEYVVTTNLITPDPLESDIIVMRQSVSINTFKEYFKVVGLDEYGIGEYGLKLHSQLN